MYNRFKYQYALLLLAFLGLSSTVLAQFAGPDKVVVRNNDNSQTVSIGTTDGDSRVCYTWSGPNIVEGVHSSVAVVNPHDSVNTYNVKRVSEYGVEEDQVIVRMLDSVMIVSITCKKQCWMSEDNINVEDFEVVTVPENCNVTVTPMAVPAAISSYAPDYTVELKFTATDPVSGKSAHEDFDLTVLDPNHKRQTCVNNKLEFVNSWVQDLVESAKVCKLIKGMEDKMKPYMRGRFEPTTECSLLPSTTIYPNCCEDAPSDKMELAITATVGLGVEAAFPFASAGVFTANAVVTAGVSLSASVAEVLTCDMEEFCFTLGGGVSIGGGVRAEVLDKDLLSATGQIVGSASLSITMCTESGMQGPSCELGVDAVMELKALSLYESKETYRLFTIKLF